MSTRAELRPDPVKLNSLWVVQIDTNCGFAEPDWQDNTPPKPLQDALDESTKLRGQGWITRIQEAK